jgi:hypothetical protein
VVVAVCGPLGAEQVRQVCDRVRARLAAADVDLVVCVPTTPADLGLVDLLARLTLVARRAGAVVRVLPTADDLPVLLQLTGLDRELGDLGRG